MNPQDILQALQNGKISIDEAESELAGNKKEASSVNVEEGLEDKEILEHGLSEELNPKRLGNPVFQERYNCKWSYFAGSMYRGISSEELVITMGKANLLSFFGSAGFGLEELEEHIKNIQSGLGDGKPYGMCLISNLDNPKKEIEQVELFVRYNIPVIEAAAYSTVTAPLVYCRIKGIYRQGERIILPRRIIGKCSNLRIAQMFLSPPPGEIVNDLLKAGLIDSEEAELSRFIPLADDLAIEADSGGHTNQGVSFSLIPAVVSLKDTVKRKYNYREEILVGCGGGIGTPEAAASAFILGADFIFTGSINQCTVESGAHDVVKDILNTVSIHDTAITAAGDMFEIGARVQVVKKDIRYAVRANNLYQLFRQYNSFKEIPEPIRLDIEKNYFKKTFSKVWNLVYEYKCKKNPEQLKEAEENPRFKMALIFKWYFSHCSRVTLNGDLSEKDNFVIYCGPALGAFNHWVKGTRYEHWKNRHVDEIAGLLMYKACQKLLEKNPMLMPFKNSAFKNSDFQLGSDSIGDNTDTAIAVIGMAGQFPKSGNLDRFWENLKNGVNCISEVPETRWETDKYFDPDPKVPGKTYSKWMGVLEDADKFDPLFFNISPAEAELMDPQQRLFLENCWSCIEDSGIIPSSLSGTRCGVFVGCASGEYQELAGEYGLNAQGLMGRAMSILSARISYLLNLKGPSMAIETACSSSLVAIAEACTNLTLGTSDLALAGGVCVVAGPTVHIMCSKSGMLSKDGQCYTFDNRANGFVPGEGAGVVLLKRLKDAVRDGDHIYGVIRGWGLNQDGKTNGITAPSVISQIQLEKDVYTKFGINPENITLIEAHGTGTKLGDPIEVEALTESFRSFTQKKNYCALGSVKSNIGHLMTGAGVAGFIKVMLALKNRMLPPSINFESVNEHISLKDSPFYVNNRLKPWEVPDGVPRSACVSAFGFSGTNAHIVVEEYIPADAAFKVPVQVGRDKALLFVLSAKTKEQLKKYAVSVKDFVRLKESLNLEDLAYTLQVGRETMDHRLAFRFDSREELINSLDAFANGVLTENIHTAYVIRNKDGKADFGEADEDVPEVSVLKKDLSKLARMWVKGADIDWQLLYGETNPQRISLPTYPFSKERFWVPVKEPQSGYRKAAEGIKAFIHPLLHENTSSLWEQRYTSVFTGDEIFLKHHIVNGQKVLPGAACLEMARAAVELAASDLKEGAAGLRLKNIIWAKPISAKGGPLKVNIALYPISERDIDYEIYGESEETGETTYFQGSAVLNNAVESEAADIEAVKFQCSRNILSKEYCYEAFRSAGLEYGEGHRGIEEIHVGQNQVLAKLSLKPSVLYDLDNYILHPGILDSALQASIGLMPQLGCTFLPFALDELEIRGRCTPEMWAHVRYSEGSSAVDSVRKLDIDLWDQKGRVCALIRGFTARIMENEANFSKAADHTGTLLFKQVWKKGPADESLQPLEYVRRLVMFCGVEQAVYEDAEKDLDGAGLLNLSPMGSVTSEIFRGYAEQLFEEISKILGEKIFGKVLVQVVIPLGDEQQLSRGLWGLIKTAELENPNLIGQLVEINPSEQRENIIEILNENGRNPHDRHVRYLSKERMVPDWEEINTSLEDSTIPWKEGGKYLITGGVGGLGLVFAEEIAHKVRNSTLILTGRSMLGEDKEARLKALKTSGARIEYITADVTDREAVKGLIREINEKFGGLDGIIHSAGVLRDGFILKKSREQLQEVLAPKVDGLVNLDEESKDLPLDFFVVFSSIAGVLGNAGQADYATANAFMDAYAEYRSRLVAAGSRKGKTVSINWPLWQEGGMKVNEETLNNMRQNSGMIAMDTERGINAFYRCMAYGEVRMMVCNGETKKLRQQLSRPRPVAAVAEAKPAVCDVPGEKVDSYLKKLLSSVIKLPADRMETDAPFEKYGIDSIMVMDLTNELEKIFGSLSKTLFFEYQSIRELSGYFMEAHKNRLAELLGTEENKEPHRVSENPQSHERVEIKADIPSKGRRIRRFAASQDGHRDEKTSKALNVAIIGISGRYPGAENLMEFWKNLRDGKDSITEIPKERWNHSLYFDEDKNRKGKTYTKWGGFIDGFDRFDPLFFNISPREAEMMDPQERLFLECVYETLEDAGYTRETLGAYNGSGMEGNVGVFAGVMYEEYQMYGVQETMQGRPVAFPGNPSSIANRVSYFFNFHGPSMAVDTMCSSSLTAIHLACQSLVRGGCELAIAGGVNLSIHPNKYLMLGQGKFASSKGRCESFGQGGDGYVPGEGVGAVLLKPLSKAVEDGDHIYGVIKGIALNHGGKTNGYTVPNPIAQAGVIARAFKESGVHPRSVSYIEAHGTGTSLGDPIEITGLNKAFGEFTKDKKFCAIGSAKSNIGHCESAAGIAGLTKVLLQMKYGELVPSLHSRILNPNIDFENTPFTVQQELSEWKRPVLEIDGENKEYPRIAGVSSFGAGGSNAHIIIEEYIEKDQGNAQIKYDSKNPAIIVLSAKSEGQLEILAERLLEGIEGGLFTQEDFAGLAYTLQTGREAMEERLVFSAGSVKELGERLRDFKEGRNSEMLYRGKVKENRGMLEALTADDDIEKTIDSWIAKGKHDKLLTLWVNGFNVDWSRLYINEKPKRVSLPTYPFARERYWVPGGGDETNAIHRQPAVIHPLVHQNTSNMYGLKFSSTFTGQEFFLEDHIVNGRRLLPGVAYIEMAREAAMQTADLREEEIRGLRIKNVVWARPVISGEQPVRVDISLYPEDNGQVTYEIFSDCSGEDDEPVIHSKGVIEFGETKEIETVDLEAVKAECSGSIMTAGECYQAFEEAGFHYGPRHRGIEKIYTGSQKVLARLSLPSETINEDDKFILHPGMTDSALQAALGLFAGEGGKLALPFAVEEVEIVNRCSSSMWAVVRHSKGSKPGSNIPRLDIDLCDEEGKICARIKRLALRVPEAEEIGEETGVLMFVPVWKEQAANKTGEASLFNRHLVILCEQDKVLPESIQKGIEGVRCIALKSDAAEIEERFRTYSVKIFEKIRDIMQERPKGKVLVQVVVPGWEERGLYSGLTGLLKTAGKENPNIMGQLVELAGQEDCEGIVEKLREAGKKPVESHIRYLKGRRLILSWEEIDVENEKVTIPWKDRGIYLITGGLGGLGFIFAYEIAHRTKDAVLILTGRSALGKDNELKLRKLEQLGARAQYRQVDVADAHAVEGLIGDIRKDFRRLDGIVHCAGVLRDGFIVKKRTEEFLEVLSPKVNGLINLDRAVGNDEMDFLIIFSSVSGSLGNAGQADYSTANAFMDSFAAHRNGLAASKLRHGRTISVNWPLWQEGGMHVDEESLNYMKKRTGMVPIDTETGIHAFYQCMASGKHQIMISNGEKDKLRRQLLELRPVMAESEESGKAVPAAGDVPREKVESYLKKLLSTVIRLPPERVEADAPLEKYGIDSVMVIELTNQLEKAFGPLSKTLFFEYQSIGELSGYFIDVHVKRLAELLEPEGKSIPAGPEVSEKTALKAKTPVSGRRNRRFKPVQSEFRGHSTSKSLDVAIIGVAGRYPGAENLEEFWENLRKGKDSITEIPKERWDHSLYFHEDKNRQGKTYTKWGGFIDGVDMFDPLFFNISPREAEMMDPQERLFLECVYETLEDAGYTRETLNAYTGSGMEGNVGVFAGVMYEEYQLYGAQETVRGRPVALSGNPSSIANRVSYFFNFHGPSMAVDTMCSSSLTAIHLACQSLIRGGCELAIAGGVNVSVHPNKYLLLGQGKFASSKGRCESFGQGGDGYVPGEGVGAVLLKPLSKAVEDGDHIYGVIKGTALNHGGKTNGYTVPNPNAQAGVIGRAFEESGVHPRSVSYIEAHGTGTSLGDPIEITGLNKAFGEFTGDKQFCAIGSAKSNIGHCESAAGIAGLTKVLLQMKYGELVPSLHSRVLNPNINFENTPFTVQQELAEWKRPVLEIDGEPKEYPRIAGISSFGAGGSNAHIIIEEYMEKDSQKAQIKYDNQNPAVIVLSAKSEGQLVKIAGKLLKCIREGRFTQDHFADLAYTLQTGREAMEERLAFTAGSINELGEKLKSYSEGGRDGFYCGRAKDNRDILEVLASDTEIGKTIDSWIAGSKYEKLLTLWVKGFNINWDKLYINVKPNRMSLPTYPFEKERYWAPDGYTGAGITALSQGALHPLVHQNTSSVYGLQFSSTFTGMEPFLEDHVLSGSRLLPGTAYLEMAREAVEQAAAFIEEGSRSIRIKNVVWFQPVIVEDKPVKVDIGLYPEGNSRVAYEVYSHCSGNDAEPVIHSSGIIEPGKAGDTEKVDLDGLKTQCNRSVLTAEQCYQAFKDAGFDYGPSHRGIEKIFVGSDKALARLSLPSEAFNRNDSFVLHPGLADSALQAVAGLLGGDGGKTALPFAVEEVEIINMFSPSMWAVIRYNDESRNSDGVSRFDIDLCNDTGEISIRIKGLELRVTEVKGIREISGLPIPGEGENDPLHSEDKYYINILEKINTGELSEEQLAELLRVS